MRCPPCAAHAVHKMITVQVTKAVDELSRISSALSAHELRTAFSRAINHSLQKSRTQAKREVLKKFNLSYANLGKSFQISRANTSTVQGSLDASHASFPIHQFSPKFETATITGSVDVYNISTKRKRSIKKTFDVRTKGQGGVTFEVFKGEKKTLPFAFMIAGKAPVFARGAYDNSKGSQFNKRTKREVSYPGSDTPIAKLITVSPYTAVINKGVINPLANQTSDTFQARVLHEISFIVNKIK